MTLLPSSSFLSPASFAVAPTPPSRDPAVITAVGLTLLNTPECTPYSADAALKSLRGFRAAGRRVVWCNATGLDQTPRADLSAWGRKCVEMGGAEMVVVWGAGAREMAVAARDAGLPLGRVVVCRDDATARNVLGDSITTGDTVLALGITAESCYKLVDRLESRFERELLVTN